MERSIAWELAEVLDKKKADFITFGNLKKEMPAALMKRLGVTDKSSAAQFEKALLPHLGEALMMKRGSRNTAYLVLKQRDEDLLLRIVQKNNWRIPRVDRVPFKKDEFFAILNQLLEKAVISVVKINKDYRIRLLTPSAFQSEAPEAGSQPSFEKGRPGGNQPPFEKGCPKAGSQPSFERGCLKGGGLSPSPSKNTTPEGRESAPFSKGAAEGRGFAEDQFKAAYQVLKSDNLYVRICDLRRRLGWRANDFDAMLIRLRDAGKIQLQSSATDSFTKDDIRDSFIDDRGLSKFLIEWRHL